MSKNERNGNRKPREQIFRARSPELGYYIIVTDTKETEQNYINGLRDSIPSELQRRLVIKVAKTKSNNLVKEALNLLSTSSQFGEIWIVFDRDKVPEFDRIINEAQSHGVKVGWTNPCIEEWFFVYFGKMPTYEDSVKCCNDFRKKYKETIGHEYDKADKDLYKRLTKYGNEESAIEIAKRKMQEHQRQGKEKPSLQCPGTSMHILISEIKSKIKKSS